jgi:hypothetical protein
MLSKKVVTPLKNGVQVLVTMRKDWIPAFAGMTEKRIWDFRISPDVQC